MKRSTKWLIMILVVLNFVGSIYLMLYLDHVWPRWSSEGSTWWQQATQVVQIIYSIFAFAGIPGGIIAVAEVQ